MPFSYVYILQSRPSPAHFYVGLTDNIQERLEHHNRAGTTSTAEFRPWTIRAALAFPDRPKARKFELYLKSASGRAFATRHF